MDGGALADAETTLEGGAVDGGTMPSACGASLPEATVNANGVLSPFPHIDYRILTPGFTIVSVNFTLTEDGGSSPLLEMFAEIRNSGTTVECSFLPDVSLDFHDIVGLVDTPPFYNEYTTSVTHDCLAPGEIGVIRGVARGVYQADIDTARSLTIDIGPNTIGTSTRALDGPLVLRADIIESASGWVVDGDLSIATTIYNYGYVALARDYRGVLVDELLAFPAELGTLSGGSTVAFTTGATACPFDSFVAYQSWILRP